MGQYTLRIHERSCNTGLCRYGCKIVPLYLTLHTFNLQDICQLLDTEPGGLGAYRESRVVLLLLMSYATILS